MKNIRKAIIVVFLLAAIVLIVLIALTMKTNKANQYDLELEMQTERIDEKLSQMIQLKVNPEYDYEYNMAEKIIVERDDLVSDAEIKLANGFRPSSFSYVFDNEIENETILIRFVANNKTMSSKIRLISESFPLDYELYITEEKRVFTIPIVVEDVPMKDVSIEVLDGDIELIVSDFEIVSWDKDLKSLKAGVFLFDEREPLEVEPILSEEQLVDKNDTYLLEIKDEYLYELAPNRLRIYLNESNGVLKRYGTVIGLGSVRELEFLNDDYLIVVSRGNGAYIIDIKNKERPQIVSHINTTELVSGLAVSNNIVFLANRYAGVEVYDLTDPLDPSFLTYIGDGENNENIDCDVYQNYLYISCWSQNVVEVWDVSNLNDPLHVNTISTAGHPYGIEANEKGLFVATGQHASTGTKSIENYNYGTGNGMMVFDISNPNEPIWASTFKGFGRYFTYGHDNWSVKVSHDVAYYSNAYGGLYIIDVKDIYNPFLIDQVVSPVDENREDYNEFKENFTNDFQLFANDQANNPNEAMSAVAIGNGELFTANQTNHIGYMNFNKAVMNEFAQDESTIKYYAESISNSRYMDPSDNYENYLRNYSVNDIIYFNNDYYVATEKNGILKLDESFEIKYKYDTTFEVKDIHIQGEFIAAAYGNDGAEIFTILPDKLESKLIIKPDIRIFEYFNNVMLFDNAKKLLVQSGFNKVKVFNIEDDENPVVEATITPGSLYYDNLFGNEDGSIVGVFGSNKISMFRRNQESVYELTEFSNPLYSESSRPTFNNEFMYFGNRGGLFRIESKDIEEINNSDLERTKIDGVNYFSAGKLFGDEEFLVSCNTNGNFISVIGIVEGIDGTVTYKMLLEIETKTSPSNVEFTPTRIIITSHKGGIIVIDKDSLSIESLDEESVE